MSYCCFIQIQSTLLQAYLVCNCIYIVSMQLILSWHNFRILLWSKESAQAAHLGSCQGWRVQHVHDVAIIQTCPTLVSVVPLELKPERYWRFEVSFRGDPFHVTSSEGALQTVSWILECLPSRGNRLNLSSSQDTFTTWGDISCYPPFPLCHGYRERQACCKQTH